MLAAQLSIARWWCPPLCSQRPSKLPLSADHWETHLLKSREVGGEHWEGHSQHIGELIYLSLIFQEFREVNTAGEEKNGQADDPGSSIWQLVLGPDMTREQKLPLISSITSSRLPRHRHQSLHGHTENCQDWPSQRHLSEAEQDRNYQGQHLNSEEWGDLSM